MNSLVPSLIFLLMERTTSLLYVGYCYFIWVKDPADIHPA